MAIFIGITAFDGPKDGRTIMEKMRDNVPLVAPIPGDYTGTFNGSVGNVTPGAGAFTTISSVMSTGNETFGTNAGRSGTTGQGNTSVGILTLSDATTAEYNAGLGLYVYDDVTTGSYNAALGSHALCNLTTGSVNVALGWEAGSLLTTNSRDILIGPQAGKQFIGDGILIIDGYGDGRSSLSDIQNEGLIYGIMTNSGADQYLTVNASMKSQFFLSPIITTTNDGKYNEYFGRGAGGSTGVHDAYSTQNTALGNGALSSISGSAQAYAVDNVAIGSSAVLSLTTGSSNIGIGSGALAALTTGGDNIGIGSYAGKDLTTQEGILAIDAYGNNRTGVAGMQADALLYGVMTAAGTSQSLTVNGLLKAPDGFSLGGTTITSTGTELNYTDGVTSAIQTQLDAKSKLKLAPSITAGTSDITCGASEGDMTTMSVTLTPKGDYIFIMFSAPFYTTSNVTYTVFINVAGSNVRKSKQYNASGQPFNLSFQHIASVTPGTSVTVKIRWSGGTTVQQRGSTDSERILTVVDMGSN
jgi:hypothetical protein